MKMTLWNSILFIIHLPARALQQIENSVFHQLSSEHGFYLLAPIILFFYLTYQLLSLSDGIRNEHLTVQNKYFIQLIILIVSIFALNCNHCLVDRSSTEYLINRSTSPDRVDSILKECEDKIHSSKMYIFLWRSFPTPGHLSAQLFDENMTYLSRWPGGNGVNFGNPISVKQPLPSVFIDSSKDDIHLENDKPDSVIIIPEGVLKEENINAIAKWFRGIGDDPTEVYKGKFKNCADLIKQALKAGSFHLANPSSRWLKLGLSIPNDIADRIVYTICLLRAPYLIRILHHVLTMIVWMISMNLVTVFLCFVRSWIPQSLWTFLLGTMVLIPYNLFFAND